MKLRYARFLAGNFGDDLNPWLWPLLLPGVFNDSEEPWFISIGSGLSPWMRRTGKRTAVFGTGASNANIEFTLGADFPWRLRCKPDILDWPREGLSEWVPAGSRIYCVRGPLTARLVGLDERLAISDPAILIRRFFDPGTQPPGVVSFMPHHLSAASTTMKEICELANFEYIDPRNGVETVVTGIRQSRLLITEALHGAIVADALRIPWVPVVMSEQISRFKWMDYCRAMGIPYAPFRLNPEWDAERMLTEVPERIPRLQRPLVGLRSRLANRGRREEALMALVASSGVEPVLSADDVMRSAETRLMSSLEAFKRDFESGFWR